MDTFSFEIYCSQLEPLSNQFYLLPVQYLAERRQYLTSAVDNLLQHYFPVDFEQRKKQHEEELADLAR